MTDFERARDLMVDNQIRTSSVTERRLLAQLSAVPRELFVPAERLPVAYCDDLHWFNGSRFLLPPATLAKLLQLAEIREHEAVLDVGVASGYSTAVIAGLAATVTGLEQDVALARIAEANLAKLGLSNARIVAGDISTQADAQFDVIIVEGAFDSVPSAFFDALRDGGRLVVLIRDGGVGVANVFVRSGKGITARGEFNATLPLLYAPSAPEQFVF